MATDKLPAVMQPAELRTQAHDTLALLLADGKAKPAELQALRGYVDSIERCNVIALADDEAFALRTNSGELRAFRRAVRLSIADGTIVQVPGAVGNIISAQGYSRLSEGAGLFTVNAPTVVVDGVEQPNPHSYRTDRGHLLAVYCRTLCFGYTMTGVPVISDRTAVLDLVAYKLGDLLSKAKHVKTAFQAMPAGERPKTENDAQRWTEYPYDEATSLWVDLAHAEVLNWLASMNRRAQKASEIAQTFAVRNAIKHHPGLSHIGKPTGPALTVTVNQWRATSGEMRWDSSRYADITTHLANVAAGRADQGKFAVVEGKDDLATDADVVEAEIRTEPDEAGPNLGDQLVQAALGASPSSTPPSQPPADAQDDAAPDDIPDAEDVADKRARLVRQISALRKGNVKLVERALSACFLDPRELLLADVESLEQAEEMILTDIAAKKAKPKPTP